MNMDSDMDITGSESELDFMEAAGAIAPLADATRPAAQGQSVRPKTTDSKTHPTTVVGICQKQIE